MLNPDSLRELPNSQYIINYLIQKLNMEVLEDYIARVYILWVDCTFWISCIDNLVLSNLWNWTEKYLLLLQRTDARVRGGRENPVHAESMGKRTCSDCTLCPGQSYIPDESKKKPPGFPENCSFDQFPWQEFYIDLGYINGCRYNFYSLGWLSSLEAYCLHLLT